MIKNRAMVRPATITDLTYQVKSIDDLWAALTTLTKLNEGVLSTTGADQLRHAQLSQGDSMAFSEIMGSHVSSRSFDANVALLPVPSAYVGTGGFALWGERALLIYSFFTVRRPYVQWR